MTWHLPLRVEEITRVKSVAFPFYVVDNRNRVLATCEDKNIAASFAAAINVIVGQNPKFSASPSTEKSEIISGMTSFLNQPGPKFL